MKDQEAHVKRQRTAEVQQPPMMISARTQHLVALEARAGKILRKRRGFLRFRAAPGDGSAVRALRSADRDVETRLAASPD